MKSLILCLILLFCQDNKTINNCHLSFSDEFSHKNLKNYLKYKKVKHPEVVYAQAILETGNFSSRIFKENNNLVGMKFVDTTKCKKLRIKYRPTVALGEKHGHAYYKCWHQSIDDYLLWQQIFKKTPMKTQEQYLALLSRYNYSESKHYTKVLRYVMKKHKF